MKRATRKLIGVSTITSKVTFQLRASINPKVTPIVVIPLNNCVKPIRSPSLN